jgi:ketosteroid isomerase-like protein
VAGFASGLPIMSDSTRALILRHWDTANRRDWAAFADLLHPELRYEVPQTREYLDSGPGYLDLFRTWPGAWRAEIRHLVCEDAKAVCLVDFVVGGEVETGISIFELTEGRIRRVTDYWPAPYEPPPRQTPHLRRRPPAA